MKTTSLLLLSMLQYAICLSQNIDNQYFVNASSHSNQNLSATSTDRSPLTNTGQVPNEEKGTEFGNQKVENLGSEVNSIYSEIRPTISADGSLLYFVVEGHPNNTYFKKFKRTQDIWFSEKGTDGRWTAAKQAPTVLNSQKTNGVFWASADGRRLLLRGSYINGKYSGRGFSMIQKTDTVWGLPEKLNIINYEKLSMDAYSGATMTNDEKTLLLYFSEEKNSFSNDIYVSHFMEKGTWSEPVKLGEPISTELYNEITPFLASDGVTMYYSSDREGGMGGQDIWMSRRLDETWKSWSAPVNVSSVNTKGWDAYFTTDASGEKAFIATSQNSIGGTDLASVVLSPKERPDVSVVVSGKVLDSKTLNPLVSSLYHEIISDAKSKGYEVSITADGNYRIVLPYGKKHILRMSSGDFAPVYDTIDLTQPGVVREIRKDIYMNSVKNSEPANAEINPPGQVMETTETNFTLSPKKELDEQVEALLFDFNRSVLRIASYDDLDKAVGILNKYPEMRVELSAHTDNIGKSSYNMLLSSRRANSVKQYLVAKGIASDRIVSKGYGEQKPVANNATREGRQLNRRVEFRAIEN